MVPLRKTLMLFVCILVADCLYAGNEEAGKSSDFNAGLELNTKYVWRGQEFCDAPVFFGTVGYGIKGFNIFALGGYGMNGKHSEVDLGISYNIKWFTVGISDYFFPTAVGVDERYFNFNNHSTKHSLEGYMTFAPDFFPMWLTVSTYFWGGDKLPDGRQAYSSYMELGYTHSFNANNSISVAVGANLNKSFYTDFKSGFNVVNVMMKYATGLKINDFYLPLSASLIFNPYTQKPYLSVSIYLNSK